MVLSDRGSSQALTERTRGEVEDEVVHGMINNGEMAGLPLILFHRALGWVLEMVLGMYWRWCVSRSTAVQEDRL